MLFETSALLQWSGSESPGIPVCIIFREREKDKDRERQRGKEGERGERTNSGNSLFSRILKIFSNILEYREKSQVNWRKTINKMEGGKGEGEKVINELNYLCLFIEFLGNSFIWQIKQ